MDLERTKLQKAILIILLAMAVVFAVITGVVRSHKGAAFEGGLLSVSQQGDRTVYSGRAEGEMVTITVCSEESAQVVKLQVGDLIDHTYRVEYPDGTIKGTYGEYRRIRILAEGTPSLKRTLFAGGYNPQGVFSDFCDENGEPDMVSLGRAVVNGSIWPLYEMPPSQVMRFVNGPSATASRGDWLIYALGVFISLITAVAAAFPEHLFYWNHALSVRDPEPTDFYMACQRVSWVIVTVVILIVYIVGATRIVT